MRKILFFLLIVFCVLSSETAFTQELLSDFEGYTGPCVIANAGANQTVCAGQTVQLGPGSYNPNYSYSWSPTAGLSAAYVANPIASPATTTTYTLTVTPKINLLVNGSFEYGNTGFNSDFNYLLYNARPNYGIEASPQNGHGGWCSGSPSDGNYMFLGDGDRTGTVRAWYQTVNVVPGHVYQFSGQFMNVTNSPINDPNITIKINGTTISDFSLSYANCQWTNITAYWSSGSSSTATVEIYNNPTEPDPNSGHGNDFAMDNLSLVDPSYQPPACPTTTSTTTVTVDKPSITSEQGSSGYGSSYAFDRGYLTILPNYDVNLCLFYASDIGVNVNLLSSASGTVQWYKNGTPISNATGTTYTISQGGMFYDATINPKIDQYTLSNSNGCVSEPLNVTITMTPSGISLGQVTSTSVQWLDYKVFSYFPAAVTAPNFDMSFSVSSSASLSSSTSSSAFTNVMSIPAVFPTTATFFSTYYNYGCVMKGNERLVVFDGTSSPYMTWAVNKPLQLLQGKTAPDISNDMNDNNILIYPNPAKTSFTVSSINEFDKIRLFSSKGALLKTVNVKGRTATVITSGFQPGIYFAHILSGKITTVKKVIVVK
jgi:hypothetical protein